MPTTFFKNIFYLIQCQAYYNSVTSVRKLTWLNYPNIISPLFFSFFLSFVRDYYDPKPMERSTTPDPVGFLIVTYHKKENL